MEKTTIKQLKRDQFFTLNPVEEPKDAPTMEFQITDIDIDKGDEKMGAPIDKDVIIIKFKE